MDTFAETKRLEQAVKAELLARAKRTHLDMSDRRSMATSAGHLSQARTWTRGQRSSGYNRIVSSNYGQVRVRRSTGQTNSRLTKSLNRSMARRKSQDRPVSSYGIRRSSQEESSKRTGRDNELDGLEEDSNSSSEGDDDEFEIDSELDITLERSASSRTNTRTARTRSLSNSSSLTTTGGREPSVQLRFKFEGITQQSLSPRSIKVSQQICSGGNSFVVFDKVVRPKATFKVTLHASTPGQFNMTIFIDNVRDLRISTCCGYKHSIGAKLGHFSLLQIEGGGHGPCRICRPPPPPPPRSPTPPPPVKERSESVSTSSGESIPEMDYEQELDKYAMDKFEAYSGSEEEKDTVVEMAKVGNGGKKPARVEDNGDLSEAESVELF